MAAVGGSYALDGQTEHGDERLGVPGPERREPGEVAEQAVVDKPGRQREVHRSGRRASVGRRGRRLGEEPLDERVPALERELEPAAAAWPPCRSRR